MTLKYYRKDVKRMMLEHELKFLFFVIVPVAWFVICPALIYGVMTVIDYLKGL